MHLLEPPTILPLEKQVLNGIKLFFNANILNLLESTDLTSPEGESNCPLTTFASARWARISISATFYTWVTLMMNLSNIGWQGMQLHINMVEAVIWSSIH